MRHCYVKCFKDSVDRIVVTSIFPVKFKFMAVDMSRQGLSLLKFLPSVSIEGVLNFDPCGGC